MNTVNRKRVIGSRPPPQKRPSTSSLSILFVMALVLVGAFVASGNLVPVDPNGPGGPPTLAPYYNPNDYPHQNIVTPTGGFPNSKKNLQLETFNVDNCGQNSVFYFVIDTSGSMQFFNKMTNEKKALTYFTSNMGGLSAIGIEEFSKIPVVDLPLTYYKDVKPEVQTIIKNLTPGGNTATRDALELAYTQLKQSIVDNDYPGYQYNLILMTDGVPEIMPPRTCEGTEVPDPNTAPIARCFALDQDPRGVVPAGTKLVEDPPGTNPPPPGPNIADEIKSLGVGLYVINVYSPKYPSDAVFFNRTGPDGINALLENVATEPGHPYYWVSINGQTLNDILKSIDNNVCYSQYNGTQP